MRYLKDLTSKEVLDLAEFATLSETHHLPLHRAVTIGRHTFGEVRVYALAGCELGGGGLLRQGPAIVAPADCFPGWIESELRAAPTGKLERWVGALFDPEADIVEVDEPCVTVINPNLVYGHFLLEMLPRLHLMGALRLLGRGFRVALPRHVPDWLVKFVLLYVDDAEIILSGTTLPECDCTRRSS